MSLEKWNKNSIRVAVAIIATLLMGLAPSLMAQGQGKGPGVKIIATLYSTLGVDDNQVLGWVGHAVITIGNQAPVQGTYFCPMATPNFRPGGEMYGTETCIYTLGDDPLGNDTFTVLNRFTALPDSAPNLYIMHTVSTITKGTGRFEKASGQLIERAEFIFMPGFAVALPALGRSEGVIFGMQ